MSQVSVGMRRTQWIKVLSEALRAAETEQNFEFTIYGKNNARSGEDFDVKLDNDDMERDDVAVDACYVEYWE